MKLQFHKLHGLGNDFMLLDEQQPAVDLAPAAVRQLADRHTGIGFDQLLRLSRASGGLLSVDIVNADGSPAEQCGNGMRAIALWLDQHGGLDTPQTLQTPGGQLMLGKTGSKDEDGQPSFYADLPLPSAHPALPALTAESGWIYYGIVPVLLGNPHWVIACDDPPRQRERDGRELAELRSEAARRYRTGAFDSGCNAGFMKVSDGQVELCVWERGAGPTRACGSGACAAAWVVMQQQGLRQVTVTQPGGRLVLEWTADDNMRMAGPARYVYQGTIDWPAA